MAEIKVVSAGELDFSTFVNLQKTAFAEIIEQTGTGYLFTDSYYRWKYSPPAGTGRIALVFDEGAPVAANSMFPLTLRSGSTTVSGWQSCDTATHPKARGKGYFMKCLAALRATLAENTVFFGFPNRNSMPGFLKFGWCHRSDVHTKVCVLPGRRMAGFRQVERISVFGPEHLPLMNALAGSRLDRNVEYMNWRYFRHPLHEYESYAWVEHGQHLGLIVLRALTVMGRRVAVAMELLALAPHAEHGLLRFAAAWARWKKLGYAVVLNNTTGTGTGMRGGYVPVPMWALPKRQVLMGAASGPIAEEVWRGPWSIQIGDWDGF